MHERPEPYELFNMTNPEIELIAEEISSAINQGRFNEAARKFCDIVEPGILQFIEPKVGRYDLQRFLNMVDQICVHDIQVKNENI